jgi:nicotinamidase/pyrazinamidase
MRYLILVDLQYDFMPGGALAVAEGDRVVAVAKRLMPHFDGIVATQDWHPADHQSFASQHEGNNVGDLIELNGLPQILWPDHCVQGTRGALLHEELDTGRVQHIIQKGTDQRIDSYSSFFDNGHRKSTGLPELLKEHGVTDVALMGLATDYCVKFTALDAVNLGLNATLIEDGCRGVDFKTGDVDRAIAEMRDAGLRIILADEMISELTAAYEPDL